LHFLQIVLIITMTTEHELHTIWSEMTCAHQRLNSTSNRAQRSQLLQLIEMYRIEYRHLTSIYR